MKKHIVTKYTQYIILLYFNMLEISIHLPGEINSSFLHYNYILQLYFNYILFRFKRGNYDSRQS